MLFNNQKRKIEKAKAYIEKAERIVATSQDKEITNRNEFYDLISKAYKYKDALKSGDLETYANLTNSMAAHYHIDQEFSKAEEMFNEALEALKSLKGENDPVIATCYGNLGAIYQSTDRFEMAIEMYEKAISVALKFVDSNHPYIQRWESYIQDVKSMS